MTNLGCQVNKIWTVISAGVMYLPVVLIHTLNEVTPVTILGVTASMVTVVVVVVFSIHVAPVTPDSQLPFPDDDDFDHSNATGVQQTSNSGRFLTRSLPPVPMPPRARCV